VRVRSLGAAEASKSKAHKQRPAPSRAGRAAGPVLPEPFARWFAERGWRPRPHQLALLDAAEKRRSTLLVAPTGAGKTLAGFLPSLVRLTQAQRERKGAGLHTLYISPLKALAVDVARNVMAPIAEMDLPSAPRRAPATRPSAAASASARVRPTS
jgi:ATP-dependent helicase Lhr and Lhr-like helicase